MNLEELMASTPPMQQHALIKGFQAGAASRDAEIAELQKAIDENWVTHQQIVAASKERDQLRAKINRLRYTLVVVHEEYNNQWRSDMPILESMVDSTLISTPEQSLAEYRNKVIEECAAKLDSCVPIWANEMRAMKEQP